MKNSIPCLATAASMLLAGAASTQQITMVPNAGSCADITPDGTVVVGSGNGGGYYWRWQTDPNPVVIGGNDAVAVSDDGSMIVGCINDPVVGAEVAGMWTQATGWVSLGYLPLALNCPSRSNAYDVSADGQSVIGLSWDGCNGRGFLWQPGPGMQELAVTGTGQNRATAIAANGSRIGGFGQTTNRSPALWLPDLTGQLYAAPSLGEVFGFTDDGGTVVGTIDGSAFYDDGSGTTSFGSLNPGWSGLAYDISEGGHRIIGFDVLSLGRDGWVWSEATGIQSLSGTLTNLGVPNVPVLDVPVSCTPDGTIITGTTFFQGAWIVELPPAPEVYCTPKVTSSGCVPSIGHSGYPSASNAYPFSITANQIESNKNGLLFYGYGETTLPFQGGILCVLPPLRRLAIQNSGGGPVPCNGAYSFDFNAWAQGGTDPFLVAGAGVFAQYWFRDPADASGFGIGLTNSLRFEMQP